MNAEESRDLVDKMFKFIDISKHDIAFICKKRIPCQHCERWKMDSAFLMCVRDTITKFRIRNRYEDIENPFFGKSLEEVKIMIDLNV